MAKCCKEHPDHSPEITRLNRASGQLAGVKRMIEEKKYCPDILTQLQAVRSAVKAVEANILNRHISQCVRDTVKAKSKADLDKKIEELIKLFKKS